MNSSLHILGSQGLHAVSLVILLHFELTVGCLKVSWDTLRVINRFLIIFIIYDVKERSWSKMTKDPRSIT